MMLLTLMQGGGGGGRHNDFLVTTLFVLYYHTVYSSQYSRFIRHMVIKKLVALPSNLFLFEIFAENTDLHEAFVIILRYKDYPEEKVLLCIHGSITSFPKQIHVVEEKNKNV